MTAEVTRETVLRLAEVAGIKIAREHRPGVIRNLAILMGQADILARAPLDPLIEPAPVYRP